MLSLRHLLFIAITLILGAFQLVYCQLDSSCTTLFQKEIAQPGGPTYNINLIPCANGDYVITGNVYATSSVDVFASRFDENFNLIWTRRYGLNYFDPNNGNESSKTIPIVEMDDGTFIIACESNAYSNTNSKGVLTLLRLSSGGNIIWQKKLDGGFDYCHAQELVNVGNDVVVGGSANENVVPGLVNEAYYIKVDINGNILNSNVTLKLPASGVEQILGVTDANNNELIAVGSSTLYGLEMPMLYKYDGFGNNILVKSYEYINHTRFVSVKPSLDGNYWVLGVQASGDYGDVILLKLDNTGNILISKMIKTIQGETANDFEVLNDGSLIITGTTFIWGNPNHNSFVSRFDLNGNLVWTKLFAHSRPEEMGNATKNLAINESNNTGVFGTSLLYLSTNGSTYEDKALVNKFSLDSTNSCNSQLGWYFTVTDTLPIITTRSIISGPFSSFSNSNFTDSLKSSYIATVCEDICVISQPICTNVNIDTSKCFNDTLNYSLEPGINYSWTPTTGVVQNNPGSLDFFTNTNTTYIISFETLDSCLRHDTVNVNIDNIVLSIMSGEDTTICLGDQAYLTLNSTNADSIYWSPPAVINEYGWGPSNVFFDGNVSTNIIVTGFSDSGCQRSDTINVAVENTAIWFNTGPDTTICDGAPLSFQTGSTDVDSIYWAPPSAVVSTGFGTADFVGTQSAEVLVSGYGPSGCVAMDTINVMVEDVYVSIFSGEDTSICQNNGFALSAYPANADSVFWSPAANMSPIPFGPNGIYFDGSIATDIIITVFNDNGCQSSDTVNVSILPCCGGHAAIFYNGPPVVSLCTGQTFQFSSSSIVSTNPTYTWDFGPNASPSTFIGQFPPQVSYDQVGNYEVRLILNDDCGSDTAYVPVVVNARPVIDILNDTAICVLDSVLLAIGSNAMDPNVTYNWLPNSFFPNGTHTQMNPSVWLSSSQIFSVNVVNEFGCGDGGIVHVTINPIPQINATSPMQGYFGEQVYFYVQGGGVADWNWSPQNNLSCTDCPNPTHTITTDQEFVVSFDTLGCSAYDTVEVIVIDTLLKCAQAPSAFSPNNDGVNDYFSLVNIDGPAPMLNLKIYNRWGEKIHDSPKAWDGKYQGQDQYPCVYTYIIESMCNEEIKHESGNVTIIR